MPHSHKRAAIADVAERRAAKAAAAPYQANVAEWQRQLARLRVLKTGASFSEDEHLRARLQLGELLETVQHRRIEFGRAMGGPPLTGAIADLERSLDRLAGDLQRELRS